ncbi:PIG-L family deacetylase [Candidatus Uhrbacteria bacterium]|nr:PIG-L family deacetylase [Candidatus Uhrbacteria bacterium]
MWEHGIKSVLVVAAHPDDEVLGCAGTVAKWVRAGATAHALILGEGETSRAATRAEGLQRTTSLGELKDAAQAAAQTLGVASVRMLHFPDNRFDTMPLLDLVKAIEGVIAELRPDTILTHHHGDLNVDHRRTFEAVLVACRPLPGASVRTVLSFETPSATEWSVPPTFAPTCSVDIAQTLAVKLDALRKYDREMRPFPHPRSYEAIEALATWRGAAAGVHAAEAFEVVRTLQV